MSKLKFISASAGTGKTYRLTTLLIQSILEDSCLRPSEVVITTYTRAAAAEIRQRCFDRLVEAASQGFFWNEHNERVDLRDKAELLTKFAVQIDDAHITDIHGICFEYISKYAVLAGYDPNVKLLDASALKNYFKKCIFKSTTDTDYDEFNSYKYAYGAASSKNFDEFWLESVNNIVQEAVYHSLKIEDSEAYCECEINKLFHASITDCKKCLDAFLDDFSAQKLNKPQKDWIASMRSFDFKTISKDDLFDNGKFGHDLKNYPAHKLIFEKVRQTVCCCETFAVGAVGCMRHLLRISAKFREDYEAMKRAKGYVDYNDMELQFLELLKQPEIRSDISRDLELIMVDEFQDCNPIQLQIFKELSEIITSDDFCRNKLTYNTYWVGDAKQAIYQFRGSDTQFFNNVLNSVPNDYDDSLNESFRSRKPIIDAVNAFFSPLYSNYKTIEAHREAEEPDYQNNNALLHWHLDNKKDRYEQLGRFVIDFVNAKMPVKPREHGMRSVEYGDIVILTRIWNDAEMVEKSFLALGIPVNIKKDSIKDKYEVELIKEFVRYVNDQNDYSRACLLHLMCDVPTANILCNCKQSRGVRWIDKAAFIQELEMFRESVKYLSVSATVKAVVARFNLLDVVGKWGDADLRQQRVMRVVRAASEFEDSCLISDRSLSFNEFLASLNDVDMEMANQKKNAVTITTYHSSKGLEWPVVVLDSLYSYETDKDNFILRNIFGVSYDSDEGKIRVVPPIQEKWSNIMDLTSNQFYSSKVANVRAEMLNLLYVGATRARDYLVTLSVNEGDASDAFSLPWLSRLLPGNGASKVYDVAEKNIDIWSDLLSLNVKPSKNKPVNSPCSDVTTPGSNPLVESAESQDEWEKRLVTEAEPISRSPLYIHPSEVKISNDIEPSFKQLDVEDYLKSTDGASMTDIGTCVHNIYAVCQPDCGSHSQEMAQRIIDGFGFTNNVNPEAVVRSIEALFKELGIQNAGEVDHELAFTVSVGDQIVRGEIDMLWRHADGKVTLIDFKNSNDSLEQIKDKSNPETYCGKYYGQLDVYRRILQQQRYSVAEMLLYYPRYGLIVEFK